MGGQSLKEQEGLMEGHLQKDLFFSDLGDVA